MSTRHVCLSRNTPCRYDAGHIPRRWLCARVSCPRRGPTHNLPNRARHSVIVATSQDWWEDEPEYDAVKDILTPKVVYLVSASESSDLDPGIRTELRDVTFQTGFTGYKTQACADQLWEGRSAPPLFYKLRNRAALDQLTESVGAAEAEELAKAFWMEVCSQNWRVALDYGLANAAKSKDEALLVVATRLGCERLLATLQLNGQLQDRDVLRIGFQGWDGTASGQLESPCQLSPSLEMLATKDTSTRQ